MICIFWHENRSFKEPEKVSCGNTWPGGGREKKLMYTTAPGHIRPGKRVLKRKYPKNCLTFHIDCSFAHRRDSGFGWRVFKSASPPRMPSRPRQLVNGHGTPSFPPRLKLHTIGSMTGFVRLHEHT